MGFNEYLTEIKQYPVLTHEKTASLISEIKSGDHSAKDELIKHNMRLVISIVSKKYSSYDRFEDLVDEGVLGLYDAIRKYDPYMINPITNKPIQFSTYATYWIIAFINKYLEKDRRVKVSPHLLQLQKKISRIREDYIQKTGRGHSSSEIAQILNNNNGRRKYSVEQVENALQYHNIEIVSLNDHVGKEEGISLEGVIKDEGSPDPERLFIKGNIGTSIEKALKKLRPNENTVIRLRFGLHDGVERTLDEIRPYVGNVTRERVRQVEEGALLELRKDQDLEDLASELNL